MLIPLFIKYLEWYFKMIIPMWYSLTRLRQVIWMDYFVETFCFLWRQGLTWDYDLQTGRVAPTDPRTTPYPSEKVSVQRSTVLGSTTVTYCAEASDSKAWSGRLTTHKLKQMRVVVSELFTTQQIKHLVM